MKIVLCIVAVALLLPTGVIQGQERDSLIIGSVSMDTDQVVVWVAVYGVTFDSLFYYDVQVDLYAPSGGILIGNVINYFPPLDTWIHRDTITMNNYRIRQVGWTQAGNALYTAGARVHLWSITFMILPGTPPQTIVIDTVDILIFGDNPVFQPGYVYYGTTAADEQPRPDAFSLFQNHPNPFNASTTIEFSLPSETDAELAIYDILGRNVRTLVSDRLSAGTHSAKWDGADYSGIEAPSGVYFYILRADEQVMTKKMILIK